MNSLYENLKIICKKNSFQKCPKPLSTEDINKIANIQICHICECDLHQESNIYYDWYTGSFRGVAHEICIKKN